MGLVSSGSVEVRGLAVHDGGPGSFLRLDVICGFEFVGSLL